MIEVKAERQDSTLTACLTGRIDASNALEFENAITSNITEGDRAVILDFENLTYISSSGLRIVLTTAKTLWKRDAKFALCSLSNQIREIFKISGFDKIINVHTSRAEALASFND